jgi:uncharacterized protein YlzI (FlbEa/FlbD family)
MNLTRIDGQTINVVPSSVKALQTIIKDGKGFTKITTNNGEFLVVESLEQVNERLRQSPRQLLLG